jgi:hypothetical protein
VLWWESDSGFLWVRYNDGTSAQWVVATPMPDVNTFVVKAGDSMSGPLTLGAGNPTAALHAAPKQYVDAFPAVRYDLAQSLTGGQQSQARSNMGAAQALRTRTVYTSGSGNYTSPAGCTRINVRMIGGGGGGGGSGTGAVSGGNATSSTFGTMTAGGGSGGANVAGPPAGGTASGGDINLQGGYPGASVNVAGGPGGGGGSGAFGGGPGQTATGNPGVAGVAGGGGGGGAAASSNTWSAAGGSAGGYCEKLLAPGTYAYAVGTAGTAGVAGTGGFAGGAGSAGFIIIDEYY